MNSRCDPADKAPTFAPARVTMAVRLKHHHWHVHSAPKDAHWTVHSSTQQQLSSKQSDAASLVQMELRLPLHLNTGHDFEMASPVFAALAAELAVPSVVPFVQVKM